ncbi:MAG: hypothetical protein ACUVQG_10050 [Thermogutta sp.]
MNKRRLTFESLEPRLVMAGKVSVSISGQYPKYDLKVKGDSLDNQIKISSDETGSTWTIEGLNGTKVNSSS